MPENKHAFTLIELLTAVTIMVLLLAIGIPTMIHNYAKAKSQKAKAQIIRLETALENYKNDMAVYPTELTDGEYFGNTSTEKNKRAAIIQALSGYDKNKNRISAYWNDPHWHGPYLDISKSEIDSSGQMLDPWKQPFLFDGTGTGRSLNNTTTFDIISKGSDKDWDSANPSSTKNNDNIANWSSDYIND